MLAPTKGDTMRSFRAYRLFVVAVVGLRAAAVPASDPPDESPTSAPDAPSLEEAVEAYFADAVEFCTKQVPENAGSGQARLVQYRHQVLEALDRNDYDQARSALGNAASIGRYFYDYARFDALLDRFTERRNARAERIMERIEALCEDARTRCYQTRTAADLSPILQALADLQAEANAYRKQYSLSALYGPARHLSAGLEILPDFQAYLLACEQGHGVRAREALDRLISQNRTHQFLDHAFVLALEVPVVAVNAEYDAVIPQIATLEDLRRVEHLLSGINLRGIRDSSARTQAARQIEKLSLLAAVHHEVQRGDWLAPFVQVKPYEFRYQAADFRQLETIHDELKDHSALALVASRFPDAAERQPGESIRSYLERLTRDVAEQEDWDQVLWLYGFRLRFDPGTRPTPPVWQADIDAIAAWKRALQFYDAGRLERAVSCALDVLDQAGDLGPYAQAANALREWSQDNPQAVEEAVVGRRVRGIEDQTMDKILEFFARTAFPNQAPLVMRNGRWTGLEGVVRDEVQKILNIEPDANPQDRRVMDPRRMPTPRRPIAR